MSELEQCYKALESIGNSMVLKSDNGRPRSAKIEKAMRITRAAQTHDGQILAKRIIQLERQRAAQQAFGPIMKSMGLPEHEEDEWSSMFSKCDDEDDDEDALRVRLRELEDEEREIVQRIREKHIWRG